MTVTRKALARRTFLRGMGTVVGLPFLDAMIPAFSYGKEAAPPVRLAYVYVPIGAVMDLWNPDHTGPLGELPRILKPMEPFKKDMLVLGNLTHNGGRALLDGGGDHARATGGYLSGVQPKRPPKIRRMATATAATPPRSRPASRPIRLWPTTLAASRASLRSKSAWKIRSRPVTATPVIRARTRTTSPGRATRSRCPRSSNRACCSSACSATTQV